MAARLMRLRRLGVLVLAGGPMMTYTVYASDDSPTSRRIKISELPLYGNPEEQNRYEFIQEEITPLRSSISSVRKSVWKYLDSIKGTTDYVKDKYEIGKAHTLSLVQYIQSDPGMLPRAGVITVAGLGGIVAGYRGGILRKMTYSSLAMLAAASLCYPDRAVEITTSGYDTVANEAESLWYSMTGGTKQGSKTEQQSDAPPANPDAHVLQKIEEIETHVLQMPSKFVGDLGQGKPEDKDLYTTRS